MFCLNSVFLLCGSCAVVPSVSGTAGRGCCALLCLGDMEPVKSDILRVTGLPATLSLATLPPPGAAGRGRLWMVDPLAGSLGLFGGIGVGRVGAGALGRSHDDCCV